MRRSTRLSSGSPSCCWPRFLLPCSPGCFSPAAWSARSRRCGWALRLGSGDLGQRIAVKTGDELEALADQFNAMAGQLQESYAGLEKKVEERTHELETRSRELAQSVGELRA